MMPKINPKMIEQAMRRFGVKEEKIEASEVIIKTPEKDLIINNPSVSKVNMMGQETIQIIGNITEASKISGEDIEMVAGQAGVSKELAKAVLEKNNGDLAKSILELKNKKR
ncbi:MAG: nascent polypeptide-associated complex protein [Nanoarchaeota archaeon]